MCECDGLLVRASLSFMRHMSKRPPHGYRYIMGVFSVPWPCVAVSPNHNTQVLALLHRICCSRCVVTVGAGADSASFVSGAMLLCTPEAIHTLSLLLLASEMEEEQEHVR